MRRWVFRHPHIFAIILSINVGLLAFHAGNYLAGCASIEYRYNWPPAQDEVDLIVRHEAIKQNVEPVYVQILFRKDKGITIFPITDIPIIVIEPCPEWRDVLRYELGHVYEYKKRN